MSFFPLGYKLTREDTHARTTGATRIIAVSTRATDVDHRNIPIEESYHRRYNRRYLTGHVVPPEQHVKAILNKLDKRLDS